MSNDLSDFSFGMDITRITVIAIGFFGNVISFAIFSRKRFQKNSISTYCQALALIDCFTIAEILDTFYLLLYKLEFNNTSDEACKALSYIPPIYNSIPVWILVAFSLDKLLNMRRKTINLLQKKWFQWSLIAGIVLFHLILYIGLPIFVVRREISPGFYLCDQTTFEFFDTLMIVLVIETCFIPFIIMIVSSIMTIRLLYKSRRLVERAGKLTASRRSRDTRYAISSVVFNFVFIPLKLPIVIYYILSSFDVEISIYYFQISILLYFFTSSSNFFVHMATNSLFRKELWEIISRSKRVLVRGDSTNNTLVPLNRVGPNSS